MAEGKKGFFSGLVGGNNNANVPVVPPAVAACEQKIAEAYRRQQDVLLNIGRQYIQTHDEKTADSSFQPMLEEYASLQKEIEEQEVQKLAVQGLRKCESCGNVLPLESAFCNKCGKKLEPILVAGVAPAPSAADNKVCPKCGKPYTPDTVFCMNCGTKVG